MPANPLPITLALELEGTLISNAMSCFPRPGLHGFLAWSRARFERVVMFTAVDEARVRPILNVLAAEGSAPDWLPTIDVVDWQGNVKDLRFIPGAEVERALLVDDIEAYAHPEQRHRWVPIAPFVSPYPETDRELERVTNRLRAKLGLAD